MSARRHPHLQEVHQSNEAPTMEWCSLRVLWVPLAMQHPALALHCKDWQKKKHKYQYHVKLIPMHGNDGWRTSLAKLWWLLTIFNIFSQRKTAKKNCCKSSTNYYTFGRKVRVGFKMPVSSCLTKMSWCRLGGIPTCRKCIKAMRLPRWNGVLWGFSAGLLRCNTRPWHCFLGWHPKSECIISNFCPSMATTNGEPSKAGYDVCKHFRLSSNKERIKYKERTCCRVRASNTPLNTTYTHWREARVGF